MPGTTRSTNTVTVIQGSQCLQVISHRLSGRVPPNWVVPTNTVTRCGPITLSVNTIQLVTTTVNMLKMFCKSIHKNTNFFILKLSFAILRLQIQLPY